jgi:hypothetical protein
MKPGIVLPSLIASLLLLGCHEVGLKKKIVEAAAPKKPTALVATPLADPLTSKVRLEWTNNATDADSIEVERSQSSAGSGFSTIASIGASRTSYEDAGLAPDTAYWYRVGAANEVGTSYSSVAAAKTYPLMSDADAVAADLAALDLGYASGDSASSVTQDLSLPVLGANGSSIGWTSDSAAIDVLTAPGSGRVTAMSSDLAVKLTASVTRGGSSNTKEFNLTVKLSDAGTVAAAKAALAIGYQVGDDSTSVTQDLTLPMAGAGGATIAWSSDDPATISSGGVVTRPSSGGDKTVTLTATISKNAASDTKAFSVTVPQIKTDAQAVAAVKAYLAVGFNGADTAGSVTQNLSLPTVGQDGVAISWSSDKPSVVSAGGIVTRPAPGSADAIVVLNATISRGGVSDTKQFSVTVKVLLQGAKLFVLDGGTWASRPDPSQAAVSVAELGGALYAADTAGLLYDYDAGWRQLPTAALGGLRSIAGYAGSLFALTNDGSLYYLDGGSWKPSSWTAPSGSVAIAASGQAFYALAAGSVSYMDGSAWSSIGAPANASSIAAWDGVLYALTSAGEIVPYDGAWVAKLPYRAPAGCASLGGGSTTLYALSYQ